MRRRSIRVFTAGVVTALAIPAGLLATAAPAAAVFSGATECQSAQSTVSMGASTTLTVACLTLPADLSANPLIHDSVNSRWHNGAVTVYTLCSWSPASVTVTCGLAGGSQPAFTSAIINHSVSANLGDGKSIAGRSFVTAINSTSSLDLSVLPTGTKSGTGTLYVENSDARTIKGIAITSGGTALTTTNGHFVAADVGSGVVATCLPLGTTITAVGSVTAATVSNAATCTQVTGGLDLLGKPNDVATVNASDVVSSARMITDGGTTAASTTVTSASANFQASDVRLLIKGTGIPAGSFITAVGGPTTVTISAAATATSKSTITGTPQANVAVQIGVPSVTAPKDADRMANLGANLALNPLFVGGSPSCSNGATGFGLPGAWYNPGKYKKIVDVFAVSIPDVTNSIGQISFSSVATTFAAYVVPTTGGGTDIVFPSVPIALANCAGAAVDSTYSISPSSASQSLIASGVGRPSTGSIRGLRGPTSPAETSYTANVTVNNDKIVNDFQTISFSPGNATGGSWSINIPASAIAGAGCTTTLPLLKTAKTLDVYKAIMGASCVGNGNVKVTGTGIGGTSQPWDVTFIGAKAGLAGGLFTFNLGTLTPGGNTASASTGRGFGGVGSVTVQSYATGTCTVSHPASLLFPCGI